MFLLGHLEKEMPFVAFLEGVKELTINPYAFLLLPSLKNGHLTVSIHLCLMR